MKWKDGRQYASGLIGHHMSGGCCFVSCGVRDTGTLHLRILIASSSANVGNPSLLIENGYSGVLVVDSVIARSS